MGSEMCIRDRFDIAQADMQNAYANIYASIGQDTFGDINTAETSVTDLARHLQSKWRQLERQLQK